MKRNVEDARRIMAEILEPLGCRLSVERLSKHAILRIDGPAGQVQKVPISQNNVAWTENYKRQDARRLARQWGLTA